MRIPGYSSLIAPIAVLGLVLFQSTGFGQNLPQGRTSSRSVGTMPISPKTALPAVTGGDREGWINGEVPKLPPLKPIVDVPMRDPNICLGPDGTYYLIGTTGDFFRANDGIEMWKSKDLVQWEHVGFIWTFVKDANDWQKGKLSADGTRTPKPLWAPELHYIKGHWYVAYCIAQLGCGVLKSTTDKPEGPYIDLHPNGPIPDARHYDTSLFEDADGKVYFLAAHGWIARMKDDLSDLAEPLRHVTMAPNCPWHEFEGPWMMKLNGRYYLFVAQGSSHDKDGERAGRDLKSSYDVWAMSAPTPYGPFGNRHLAFPYAGHNTVFQGSDGRWWSTWGTSDRKQSVGLPFYEKPAIIPIEMDSEGKLRPATP